MTAQELRIGNFIHDDEGCLHKVTGFTPFEHSVRCDDDEGCEILVDLYRPDGSIRKGLMMASKESRPIPLTPEILVACGFEHLGEPFRRWVSDEIGIDITEGPDNKYYARFIKRYRMSGNTMYSDRNGPNIEMIFCPRAINSLHDLMNFWHSITGTELTFNPEKVNL